MGVYLFIQSISCRVHAYLLYHLTYSLILYFLNYSNIFIPWALRVLSGNLCTPVSFFSSLQLFISFHFALQDGPDLCICLILAIESVFSSRNPDSFYLRMICRKLNLNMRLLYFDNSSQYKFCSSNTK